MTPAIIPLLAFAALLGSATLPAMAMAMAQPSTESGISKYAFDRKKLRGLCNQVYSRTPDTTKPAEWSYAYERSIYEAAKVDFARDTPAAARRKLKLLWLSSYESHFQCNATNFQVPRGNILKYAIDQRTYGLLDNAAKLWGLNLNLIDVSDGRTILDFLDDKIEQAGGSETGKLLSDYRNMIAKRGAARCRDLIAPRYCHAAAPGSADAIGAFNRKLLAEEIGDGAS